MRMCTRNSWIVLLLVVAAEGVAWSCHRQTAPLAPAPASASAAPSPTASASGQSAAAAPANPGGPASVQPRVAVQVTEAGFVPSRIPAQVGKPLILVITRKTDKTCAREILFKGQAGKTDLPLNKEVEVTYTPQASGAVAFGCAMGMMIGGTLDVR